MNRLAQYFTAAKLAKQFIVQAAEYRVRGETDKALKMQEGAIRELVTAMNNVASIAFEPRRKR
jgi:hypothetical protein